jgi:hypothetical protein
MSLLEKRLSSINELLNRLAADGFDAAEILSDQEANPTISEMAYYIACHYIDSAHGPIADVDNPFADVERSEKFAETGQMWLDVAARLGSYDACLRILYSREDPVERSIAAGIAFNLCESAMKETQEHAVAAAMAERMATLIGIAQSQGLHKSRQFFESAIKAISEHTSLTIGKNGILRAFHGSDDDERGRVLVFESVAPSSDRSVKDILALYSRLEGRGIPVAQVGNLREVSRVLDIEYPWFRRATAWIVAQLAARQHGDYAIRWAPCLIVGPPGIGKTSYVRRMTDLIGVHSRLVSLAGSHDNRMIAGTARGWSSGAPSMIASYIRESFTANPAIIFDELDKAGGSDYNGRIHDTLLSLLEPASAAKFFDEFLLGNCNLSFVNYIFTANQYKGLPETLLSVPVKPFLQPRTQALDRANKFAPTLQNG